MIDSLDKQAILPGSDERPSLGTSRDPVSGPSILAQPEFIANKENMDMLEMELLSLKGRVSSHPQTAAVILAGGTGARFHRPGGKQLLEVFGKPILTWSAEAFDAVADVGLIVVVCPEDRMQEYCHEAIDSFPFVTPVVMAPAGEIRQESSLAGLNLVGEEFEFVAIHDGARPLITPALIEHTIAAVKGSVDYDGAVVGYPAIDTLKIVSENNILGTPDRSAFWTAQTPQVFRTAVIKEAHRVALTDGFVGTDDSSLVERIGGKIALVEGPRNNIKITVPEDTTAVEAGLRKRQQEIEN
ncbi:MAG: 2-C-methyl-D-erythritol 4-phosphate cytidylyltransferase [Coriobacteriia bacterium]|nr:2-C-methyl-D-erythritol 4-phosphate cytidylyltransferase [Coriobacteriia bacterium]MCL2750286.1 2-C-methyl-D-erythritol 4-phosphate cytidylyltransferase [Coriobacteriia bacterium]